MCTFSPVRYCSSFIINKYWQRQQDRTLLQKNKFAASTKTFTNKCFRGANIFPLNFQFKYLNLIRQKRVKLLLFKRGNFCFETPETCGWCIFMRKYVHIIWPYFYFERSPRRRIENVGSNTKSNSIQHKKLQRIQINSGYILILTTAINANENFITEQIWYVCLALKFLWLAHSHFTF